MGKSKTPITGRRPYWTAEEDAQLVRLVKKYGTKNWGLIAKELESPVQRKGKSCRSRWMHQLNPSIKHEPFSAEEERILVSKQREFGNKWSKIAAFLPGRTDNAIKNHWHGHVKRRVLVPSHSQSSSNDDLMEVEFKQELWNQMTPRRQSVKNSEIECANILLQLSKSEKSFRSGPAMKLEDLSTPCEWIGDEKGEFDVVTVKREMRPEGEDSESSKETNNDYGVAPSQPTLLLRCTEGELSPSGGEISEEKTYEQTNNSSELIQPSQQKLLSDTLESFGLAHYPILPLHPIKEEEINSEEHVVIVLHEPSSLERKNVDQDSCSDGASVCLLPEEKIQSHSDWKFQTTNSSSSAIVSKRSIPS